MFEYISSTSLFVYLIILLLSVISITLLVLLIHSGLFNSVEDVGTGKPPLGKVVIAYKFLKGPYSESGQTFTEAHILAPDNRCLGIYYDDPKKVPVKDLRHVVGSILASDASQVDSEMLNRFTEKGYKTITLPEVEFAVKTSFPHVTTLSILIAIHKAYPRLAEYIEDCKLCAYPFLEFYDGKAIHFFAPLSKQDEFCVPECQELDGRGDETVDSSDGNTTLNTTVGDESVEDTPKASPDVSILSADSPATPEEPQNVKDETERPSPSVVEKDEVNGAEVGEDEDNSSSSSFEVVKNEAGD